MALSAVLPPTKPHELNTIFTVLIVTALSTIAMVTYPILASAIGFNETEAGIFLGGTIHDVAQVVGAGYSISETAGNTATIIKLFRVALLIPIVRSIGVLFTWYTSNLTEDKARPKPPFPWFFRVLLFRDAQ